MRIQAVVLASSFLFPLFAQKQEMTYEQYLADLSAVVQREKTAREQIATEQARIESLRQQIHQMILRIGAVIQEKYAVLGITEQDVTGAEMEIEGIKAAFQQYSYLSVDEIHGRKADIEQVEARFGALKAKRVALLYRVADKIRAVEPLVAQVLERLRQPLIKQEPVQTAYSAPSSYTVGRDGAARSLSQIAQELYGDQNMWPRIYRANKALISRWYERYQAQKDGQKIARPQDFILHGWTLEIPR